MTKQRAIILEVIRSDMCHHTAEEIFILARNKYPRLSRATVYNNLKALEEAKEIRRITGDELADRYDNSYTPHGHLICESCGCVKDFAIEALEGLISDAIGTEYSSYELKVRYRCTECGD